MQRYSLGVEYDGSRYCGWQRQKHCDSVQQRLEDSLADVANHPITVHCAGRTDAGVHACGQVVHFDTTAVRANQAFVLGANTHLPPDVSVLWACPVASGFHARFSAVERRYRYLILNTRERSALFAQRAWVVHEPLAVAAMQAAADCLLGEHDFSAFRAAGCQANHPRRSVRALRVLRHQQWVIIDVAANAFLQNMVRNITGLLMHIGRGSRAVADAQAVLASRDRKQAGLTAPARGLYLTEVMYPPGSGLPQPATGQSALLPVLPLLPTGRFYR